MKTREQRIKSLLLNEIATKSIPAAITFAIMAILIFFYRFNLVHLRLPLQMACIGVIIASSLRVYIARKHKLATDNINYWQIVRYSVWLNTLSWAVIIGCSSWELQATGIHYMASMIIMVGFAAASLFTLSYDPLLFFPFNFFLVGTPGIIAAYQGIASDNPAYFLITFTIVVFNLYQARQYKEYRSVIFDRFNNQVELEDSNQALKESQETLINQTMKLVQASKASALGEMAGGLSHEVNNSLMVILGSLQQLERKIQLDHGARPEYEKKMERMVTAIHKIKSVVDGLRFYSQETEHSPRQRVALWEIMERTLNYCHEMLKAHSIQLQMELVPEAMISCQPMQITQAIFSILKNADDALMKTKEPAEKWVKIKFRKEDGKIKIKISNGGPTIEESVREKLFQPFFTTKDVGEGTGLSLSIAKGIFREHGGDLSLDEGHSFTCFTLELPLA
ncbi:MAG: ATP-binding protein [Bdellovibrionota bacterium]